MDTEAISPEPLPPGPSLARSAALLSAGNIASKVLGMVRVMVISGYFGTGGYVSAFQSINRVIRLLYDLLVGGMMNAAVVPVLSEYAASRDKSQLWETASAILTLMTLVLVTVAILISLFVVPLVGLLVPGLDPIYQASAVRMLRLMVWAVLFFGMAGLLTGLLFSLQRFTFPALTTAVFNLTVVVAVPLLAGRLDVYSLAVGTVLGSLAQTILLLPGLRDAHLRPVWRPLHPALIKVWHLYLPLLVGLLVGQAQVLIDTNLASRTGEHSLAWMQNATALRELPLGLIAMAISSAVLPRLSQHVVGEDMDSYRATLGYVLKLVIVLTLPATALLAVFAFPTVRVVLQRGAFHPVDTQWTSYALWGYLPGLFFASVDWPLNYSFYARQDTRTPTIVGIGAVGAYLLVALPLVGPLGMIGLVLADSAKHAFHASTMLVMLRRRVGAFGGRDVAITGGKALLAAGLMSAVGVALLFWMQGLLGTSLMSSLVVLVVGGGASLAVYVGALLALGIDRRLLRLR